MTAVPRRAGRPAGPPSSGSEAVDAVVVLLRDIRKQAQLSVGDVHELLKTSGHLEGRQLPARSTLYRKLNGAGLKNERRLVEAIVRVCVPDEQLAEDLSRQAVELLRHSWLRDAETAEPQPVANTADGDPIAELVRVQRELIEVQGKLAVTLQAAAEADKEAAQSREDLATLPTLGVKGSAGTGSEPALNDGTTRPAAGAEQAVLLARLATAEAERDEAQEAASAALSRVATVERLLAAHSAGSASSAHAGPTRPTIRDDARIRETGRTALDATTSSPGSDTPLAGGTAEREERGLTLEQDAALADVLAEMLNLDPDGSRMGSVIDSASRHSLDPAHTGRYLWSQLTRVEKTGFAATMCNRMQHEFGLSDGWDLDFSVAGHEVEVMFTLGRTWMFSPELEGKLCFVMRADETRDVWSLGLLRVRPEALSKRANLDRARTLSAEGRDAIRWIHHEHPLPEQALRKLPADVVEAIFAGASSRERVEELFLRAEQTAITPADLAAVTMQSDFARRARQAQDNLASRGVLVLNGKYYRHVERLADLGLPAIGPDTWMSVRLAPAEPEDDDSPTVLLDRAPWRVARPDDSEVPLPVGALSA